jgi:hypothetical protein
MEALPPYTSSDVSASSIPPEPLEAIGCQFSVPHGMLNVLVPEVSLHEQGHHFGRYLLLGLGAKFLPAPLLALSRCHHAITDR